MTDLVIYVVLSALFAVTAWLVNVRLVARDDRPIRDRLRDHNN